MRLSLLPVVLSLTLGLNCTSRQKTGDTIPASAQTTRDAATLVPAGLNFAKSFVQLLLDSGWNLQPVRASKLNGFFRATNKAAWIDTDKGVFEVVFFDNSGDVEQIQITDESSNGHHKYLLKTPSEAHRMEGSATYFTKHQNMLIVTIDARLNDAINRLLASSKSRRA